MRRTVRTTIARSLLALVMALPLSATHAAAEPGPGDLDAGFGGFGYDGKLDPVAIVGINVYAMALQPDEKIVLAGQKDETFALIRYNPGGTLDATFGVNGLVETTIHSTQTSARVLAVAIQKNGAIVAAGDAVIAGNRNMAVARYKPDGTLDASFSADGKTQSDFDGGNDEAYAVAVQSDGKVVVAGEAYMAKNLQFDNYDFALARFTADGALDTSFGGNGKVTVGLSGGSDDGAHALAIQPDGKLLIAGATNANGSYDFLLARYNANGSLDSGFGASGHTITNFGSFDVANALALRADGAIAAAGCQVNNTVSSFALFQYSPRGLPDPSFHAGGPVFTSFGGSSCANGVAFSGTDRLVAVGRASAGGTQNFALAQYRTTPMATTSHTMYIPIVAVP
jgi:uncharacterized delta-60 repeat protein